VLTVQGELAVRRLGALKAFHDRVARDFAREPSSIGGTGLRTLREAVLVRCVSVLEAYVTDLGEEVFNRRLKDQITESKARVLAEYLGSARWQAARSWAAYEEIWSEGLGISLGQFTDWNRVKVTRAARNAIVHAFGEYNAEYRRIARTKLEGLGIDPDRASGRIPLDGGDVDDGLGVGRAFVMWVDPQVA
jgi:hypothetical protein